MLKWNVGANSSGMFSQHLLETRNHLFFKCHYSMEVWSGLTAKLLSTRFTTVWHHVFKLLMDNSLGHMIDYF